MHLGLLVSLNLIVNNFSWQHHFVFMIFPFLVTLFYVQKIKINLKLLFVLSVSYLLISFNLKNPNVVPVLLQSHVFYGAILLWILQVYLILKIPVKILVINTVDRHNKNDIVSSLCITERQN